MGLAKQAGKTIDGYAQAEPRRSRELNGNQAAALASAA
jgi:hypothetical protein